MVFGAIGTGHWHGLWGRQFLRAHHGRRTMTWDTPCNVIMSCHVSRCTCILWHVLLPAPCLAWGRGLLLYNLAHMDDRQTAGLCAFYHQTCSGWQLFIAPTPQPPSLHGQGSYLGGGRAFSCTAWRSLFPTSGQGMTYIFGWLLSHSPSQRLVGKGEGRKEQGGQAEAGRQPFGGGEGGGRQRSSHLPSWPSCLPVACDILLCPDDYWGLPAQAFPACLHFLKEEEACCL